MAHEGAYGTLLLSPSHVGNNRLNMKIRIFPDALVFVLALFGVLSVLDEAWRGPAPPPLVAFLLTHHLWHIWNELRWQHMYTHEVLHFLSGLVGSVLGCWIYFAFQKRKKGQGAE
jgi:hypothetical protein